jgi:predicted acetyltransferase
VDPLSVEIVKIPIAEKSVLRNLVELYRYDFSEIQHADVTEHGVFGYRYLDHYWTDGNRTPFFIRADGKLAGFALIRHLDDGTYSIAEFFVMRAYRRRGVGRMAVRELFARFGGRWSFDVVEDNTAAIPFWRSVAMTAEGGEEWTEEGGQRVLRFSVTVE